MPLLAFFVLLAGRTEETVAAADALRAELVSAPPEQIRADAERLAQQSRPSSDPEQAATEAALRQAAVALHTRAKKIATGPDAEAAYDASEAIYRLYFAEFPQADAAYEMHYAFGELLYKRKKYEEAYAEYLTVAELNPTGSHTKFCLESAIFAADELAKREEKPKGSLSPGQQKSVEATHRFLAAYPEDPKALKLMYREAYLYYNQALYPEADLLFRAVIAKAPGTKEAEQAANLVLDGLVMREDWRGLQAAALQFYELDGLGSPAFKQEVHDIWERAGCKLGEPPPGARCP